ncbi:MAG TPA: GNAT family protein [Opitutaceae bacterium]|jgi:RimJ/RimL family protein N-acetyltransferase|nr:GNAT family protein [Opitutaceae bacterium]
MSIFTAPTTLEGHGVRLEPMELEHEAALQAATADGQLWRLHFTAVPEPENTRAYIETALAECAKGIRRPFVVRELGGNRIIGATSYHDILPAARRVEIGYTFYARSWQRTHVNTACKYLLMQHAFEKLDCTVVGWRTDILNTRSQAAIERLGAKKDGVIRRYQVRRDGTIRDTVMYSVTAEEWQQGIKAHLGGLLSRR